MGFLSSPMSSAFGSLHNIINVHFEAILIISSMISLKYIATILRPRKNRRQEREKESAEIGSLMELDAITCIPQEYYIVVIAVRTNIYLSTQNTHP